MITSMLFPDITLMVKLNQEQKYKNKAE
jgi:hypothetical protein